MEAAIAELTASGASVQLISPLRSAAGPCASVPLGNNCSSVLLYGFKRDLDAYLAATPAAPVSSLAELVAFNAATPGAIVYGQQLAPWVDAFGAESIFVSSLEAMTAAPQVFLERVGAFLGHQGPLAWREELMARVRQLMGVATASVSSPR